MLGGCCPIRKGADFVGIGKLPRSLGHSVSMVCATVSTLTGSRVAGSKSTSPETQPSEI